MGGCSYWMTLDEAKRSAFWPLPLCEEENNILRACRKNFRVDSHTQLTTHSDFACMSGGREWRMKLFKQPYTPISCDPIIPSSKSTNVPGECVVKYSQAPGNRCYERKDKYWNIAVRKGVCQYWFSIKGKPLELPSIHELLLVMIPALLWNKYILWGLLWFLLSAEFLLITSAVGLETILLTGAWELEWTGIILVLSVVL